MNVCIVIDTSPKNDSMYKVPENKTENTIRKRSLSNFNFNEENPKRYRHEEDYAAITSSRRMPAKRKQPSTTREPHNNTGKRQRKHPQRNVRSLGIRHILQGSYKIPDPVVSPIAILLGQTGDRSKPQQPLVALLDSGTTSCIAISHRVPFIKRNRSRKTNWATKAGSFQTSATGRLTFVMPEFSTKPKFEFDVHIDERQTSAMSRYDVILGTNFLKAFGINLLFNERVIEHEGATIPMRNRETIDANIPLLMANAIEEIFETEATKAMVSRMTRIAESKYEPANLDKVVRSCLNLTADQQSQLHELLTHHEAMFDGQLGEWKMEPISIELKKDARPVHSRPYTIPKIYEETVKNEIEQFLKRGILKRVNRSQWASPTFIVPKKLNVGQTIPSARVVVDFRRVNEMIVRKPYPIPKISHLLMTLEGFKFATSLDLIQGYHQMPLDDEARKICTIVLPWGKYEYTRLPMGIKLAGDAFQERMNELLGHLPYVDVIWMTFSSSQKPIGQSMCNPLTPFWRPWPRQDSKLMQRNHSLAAQNSTTSGTKSTKMVFAQIPRK